MTDILKGEISAIKASAFDVILPALGDGVVIPDIPSLDTYTNPAVNDEVAVIRSQNAYLVLGRYRRQ